MAFENVIQKDRTKDGEKSANVVPFFLIIFIVYFGFSGMEGIFAIWIKETFVWGPREVGIVMLVS